MVASYQKRNKTWVLRVVLSEGEEVKIGDEVEVEKFDGGMNTEKIAAIIERKDNVVLCAKLWKYSAFSPYAFTGRRGQ